MQWEGKHLLEEPESETGAQNEWEKARWASRHSFSLCLNSEYWVKDIMGKKQKQKTDFSKRVQVFSDLTNVDVSRHFKRTLW